MAEKKRKLVRGFVGINQDPQKPLVITFKGEMWPSEEADSEYSGGEGGDSPQRNVSSPPGSSHFKPPVTDVSSVHNSTECNAEIVAPSVVDYIDIAEDDSHDSVEEVEEEPNGVNISSSFSDCAQQNDQVNRTSSSESGALAIPKTRKRKLKDQNKVKRRRKTVCDSDDERPKKRRRKRKKNTSMAENIEEPEIFSGVTDNRWANSLPSKVLAKIFSYVVPTEGLIPVLDRMCQVSPLWAKAAQEESLWEQVDLSWGQGYSEIKLIALCEAGQLKNTRELNLTGWVTSLTPRGIQAITKFCPELTAINLSHCARISAGCIRLLVDHCKNLGSFDLSALSTRSSSTYNPVSSNSIKYIASGCGPRLTHLCLAENHITGFIAIIKAIAESCPNFQVLDASNITGTSQCVVLPVEHFQKGCPSLRVLRLANNYLTLAAATLSEQAQAPGFPNLEELSLAVDHSIGLGDSDLERLLKASNKLKLLDLRGCRNISVSGLVRIPAWDLQHLYLSQCSAASTPNIELIMSKWSHSLKEVDLSWAVNSEAVNSGVMALATSERGSNLKNLDLCGSSVTYVTIKKLLQCCPSLNTVNLQSCRSLPRGMKRLYQGADLVRLREEIIEGRFLDPTAGVEA